MGILSDCMMGTLEEAERVKESARNVSMTQKKKRGKGMRVKRVESMTEKIREKIQGLKDVLSRKFQACVDVSGTSDEGDDDNADDNITILNVTRLTEVKNMCRDKFRRIREKVKHIIEEEEAPMCCMAMTPQCQACALGMTAIGCKERSPRRSGCAAGR